MNAERIEYRAARISFVTGLSTVLTLAFQLISVPVCLAYWGEETYGKWLALLSAFMLFRSLDTGFTVYVGNKLNYLYHEDTRALREHLSSAVAGIAVISLLQLLLASATFAIEPLSDAFGLSSHQTDGLSAKWGLLTLVISWVLTGPFIGILHRLLIPSGLMYQAVWWSMGFQASQFTAIMLAAAMRMTLLQASFLFAFSQVLIYVSSAIYVRYKLPDFSPWVQHIRPRIGLNDLRSSLLLTLSNLIQQAATNGSVLLVSALAGPVAVPAFTTVRTMTNVWTSVTGVLTGPLLPEVVRIHVKGHISKLLALNQAFFVLAGSAVNAGALLSFPLIPYLYGRWTTHTVVLDSTLLCLMLGTVVVANAGALISVHLNGINSLKIVLSASVARAGLLLGVGAIGYGRLGLASFGLGALVGELMATAMTVHYFVERELRLKGVKVPVSLFGPVALSLGATLAFFFGAAFKFWSGNAAWIFALFCVAIAAGWGWNSMDPEVRLRLSESAARVLGRQHAARHIKEN